MPTINVAPETFVAAGRSKFGHEVGTVEVNGQRQVAARHDDGDITVAGWVGRYRTSNKAWQATLVRRADGTSYATFGRDERSGRFNKLNGISYEPDRFPSAGRPYWTAV